MTGLPAKLISHACLSAESGGFTFLHLRIENDWVEHCKRWESIADGKVRNNCLQNSWNVHEALLAKRVTPSRPLYVAAMWSDTEPTNRARVMNGLESAGFKVGQRKTIGLAYLGCRIYVIQELPKCQCDWRNPILPL